MARPRRPIDPIEPIDPTEPEGPSEPSPIEQKYAALGGVSGFLGAPTIPEEQTTPDGVGRYRHYQGGSIYWTPQTGAHEVHGYIRGKWAEMGWERSFLGYPVSDELTSSDGVGRYSRFQNGLIFWTPPQGANPAIIANGNLYRETSQAEVYLVQDDKKIWIPTPDALFVMGHDWSQVNVVPDGALAAYNRFNIPSSSPTPGSLVFPPNRTGHFPLYAVPSAVTVISQDREIQLVELFGWLRMVDINCGDGDDFHYALELDTDWAIAQGIDLNRIFRAGSVAHEGIGLPGFSPRRCVSLPIIKVELNAWGWHGEFPPNNQIPNDWIFPGNCGKIYPFDHHQPNPSKPKLNAFDRDINTRGPYVRIAGSLVTDTPHAVQHRIGTFLSRYTAITPESVFEWEGSVPDWHPGLDDNHPDHFACWTEIHPPDLVEILDWKEPRVTTRAVALCARVGVLPFGLSNSCEEVEFDIFPEAQRLADSQIAYQELRGPECYFPWGENAENGSWITAFDDHIRIKARVCGGALGGSPGRFKAIYLVWWE